MGRPVLSDHETDSDEFEIKKKSEKEETLRLNTIEEASGNKCGKASLLSSLL